MKAVVVAAGTLDARDASWLDGADLVIAADGGAATLNAIGRRPDLLVGDLDSVDASLVDQLAATGTRVERHPADKDASDTEIAIEAAIAAGATEVVILAAVGGDRLDHELSNVLQLADPALAGIDLRVASGRAVVRALRGGHSLTLGGEIGDTVTLLPVGGDAVGVTTDGLRWPLKAASLAMGRSRGLSNEVTASPASISVEGGTILVIETSHERSHLE